MIPAEMAAGDDEAVAMADQDHDRAMTEEEHRDGLRAQGRGLHPGRGPHKDRGSKERRADRALVQELLRVPAGIVPHRQREMVGDGRVLGAQIVAGQGRVRKRLVVHEKLLVTLTMRGKATRLKCLAQSVPDPTES